MYQLRSLYHSFIVLFAIISYGKTLAPITNSPGLFSNNNLKGWFPLPILGTTRPVTAALTVADNVALQLINSMRATFQAPPVTYSTALRDLARTCAQTYVTTFPGPLMEPLPRIACAGTNAGVAIGYNGQSTSNGVRGVISDTSGGSWFFQWINNPNLFPPVAVPALNAATQDFTQMVWVASTQVGCAFSPTTVMINDATGANPQASFIYICLFTPAGNVAGQFATNVLADL